MFSGGASWELLRLVAAERRRAHTLLERSSAERLRGQ